ncbi:MAG: transketolase [Candidatus Marinimicrobia bacterium]|nr:transketolase [Candidatus Neomarinimicrobiota bacterium]
MESRIDQLCVNTLRFLAVDMVEAANSGHPGMPLGAAPMAHVIWSRFLNHNPHNPDWFNRDRFILSPGHGSTLLYGLLHLHGYDLTLDELRNFRQWGSKTPGHPEYGLTPGVECTTGPLGQGFAMGVGMAMAERFMAEKYNRNGFNIIDHYTYALVSDGDLMEGVSYEAASLAGLWGLGKLIYLYDSNRISIEGSTDLSFTENVESKFDAQGWQVLKVDDGKDLDAIEEGISLARLETDRPSLVIIRTNIGFGSPKQDDASSHGAPLGPEAVKATRKKLEWPAEPLFHIPEEVSDFHTERLESLKSRESEWNHLLEAYASEHMELANSLREVMSGELPEGWQKDLPIFSIDEGPLATRSASGQALNGLAKKIDNFMGGSADLSPSNKTVLAGKEKFGLDENWGPNIHFGVREHAMAAICNGAALHGGVVPYAGTFLVFADYMRPALRLAALMQTKTIFIFTHDSIGVGEDGPTHQPIEHIMTLRAIPGLTVLRPADANETALAWKTALESDGPVALLLSRQKLPVQNPVSQTDAFSRGAYILSASSAIPEIILIATGSEVNLAIESKAALENDGLSVRVVSMPSWELFEKQPENYRRNLLLNDVPKLAIEAGITQGWRKYADDVIGLDHFGASAPGPVVFEKLGFTVDNIVKRIRTLLND